MSTQDISGEWHGTYTYPSDAGPPTPFIAKLNDSAGQLSGEIIEPDNFYSKGETLTALINGHHSGQAVDFTKVYCGQTEGYENPVDYVGQLSADGNTISGVWSLLDLDGRFEMFRETEQSEAVERKEVVEVPLDANVH